MKLTVGERLPGFGPAHQPGGYVVTGVVRETPWSGLYAGKKIFYNFDFTSKRPRETDDKEWLDVFLRTIQYPVLDDGGYVARRRDLARTEARRVLAARGSNVWPEPLDVLELPNTRDPFTFRGARKEPEPVLVFARPQGQTLDEWRENVLPLASILGVLAELLEFVRLAHDEGLLLAGLSPAAVVVDGADRVHYVGSDLVVAAGSETRAERGAAGSETSAERGETRAERGAAGSETRAEQGENRAERGNGERRTGLDKPPFSREEWSRLFPPQRFARGYAPPESLQGTAVPDCRGDVYAWAAVAFFLLTGDNPEHMALEQEQWWATFHDFHFDKLEKILRGMPPAHVRIWGDQLGVEGAALVAGWPANLLALFRQLLAADRQRRPSSVAELREWILAPPPSPVTRALALRLGPTTARLFLDLGAADPDTQLVIRRRLETPPAGPTDGIGVGEGRLASQIEDTKVPDKAANVWYSVFTRKRRPPPLSTGGRGQGEEWVYSRGLQTELIDPAPAAILRLAEQEAAGISDAKETPGIALLFQALETDAAAEALLASHQPTVRRWAIHRLLVALELTPRGEAVLWRALRDPVLALRIDAARGLLIGPKPPSDDRLRRTVEALTDSNVEEAVQVIHALRGHGLSEDLVRRLLADLESDRPIRCPVCQVQIPNRERFRHLVTEHGYLEVDGTLLSRPDALARLWEQVATWGDGQAHRRLLEIFHAAEQPAAYVAGLEAELGRRTAGPGGGVPRSVLETLVRQLRREPAWPALVPGLVRAKNPLIREIGRELLLPDLANRVRRRPLTAADLDQQIDRALPGDDLLQEKIHLCLRLPHFGIDLDIANTCLAQLQEQRPIQCGECGQKVRLLDLETHLRRAHGIFEYQGVRRTYHDLRAFLLDSVCGTSPDFDAWNTLLAIAREKYADEADRRLVTWIGHRLEEVDAQQRPLTVAALAEVVATGAGAKLLPALSLPYKAADFQAISRHLALEIAGRLPPPVPRAVVESLHPLLADKQIPRATRQAAVAALLRSTGPAGPAARALLMAYLATSGKLRAIDKLHELEERVGQVAEIDALAAQLEDQVRMNCPRCGMELPRLQMVDHLWDEHRLVLEGRRVREPWRLIEDWIEDYRLERDAAVLDRCRDLARRLEGPDGLHHLQRLLLRHGIEDREAMAILREQARQAGASLCPHCLAHVPVQEPPELPPPLTFDENKLEGHDFRLEVSEGGLRPWLEIQTPRGLVVARKEPDRGLTRNGVLAVVIVPIAVASFLLTEFVTRGQMSPALVVAVALGVALFLGGLVFLLWPAAVNLRDRLVHHAWTLLVPRLCKEGLTGDDADFLAGLARISPGLGQAGQRSRALETVLEDLQALVRKHPDLHPHLAAVARLYRDESPDNDPLPFLADQAELCFTAKLPLSYAGLLLGDLFGVRSEESPGWWTPGVRARLAVLLCDRAFSAGLEVSDVVDLGRACPALGKVMAVDEIDILSQRRLLWSFRASKPWEKNGPAATVFQLAREENEEEIGDHLWERFPDLLLALKKMPVYLCGRGLWFERTWIADMPGTIEVIARKDASYELVIDEHRFRFDDDPSGLADRLERWCRYYFRDFLPQAGAVGAWEAADVVRRLIKVNGTPCPDCRKLVIPRLGEIGVSMETGRGVVSSAG